jgi:prepilin-type N-terminal cleavage/methylation domain-containing protein
MEMTISGAAVYDRRIVECQLSAVIDGRYRKRSILAFTLIELLVVIVIVAVLMGLAFPVFQGVQNQAKKTQARNDLIQIVTAVNAFYTEYGRYPSTKTTDAKLPGDEAQEDLMDALRAKGGSLNPRGIVFLSPSEAKDSSNPQSGIAHRAFFDPWGTPYFISIDADYDNDIANPYDPNTGAGPEKIRQGVIAWSQGKDRKSGKGGNNKFAGSDDVVSWQ